MHKIERVSVAGCIWMISSKLAGGEEGGGGGLSSGKPLCATALLWYAACPRVCAHKVNQLSESSASSGGVASKNSTQVARGARDNNNMHANSHLEVKEQQHKSVNEAGNFSRVAIHRKTGLIGAGRAVELDACRHHDCFF